MSKHNVVYCPKKIIPLAHLKFICVQIYLHIDQLCIGGASTILDEAHIHFHQPIKFARVILPLKIPSVEYCIHKIQLQPDSDRKFPGIANSS